MTEWRWIKKGLLDPPIKINGRNYRTENELIEFQQRAATENK